MTKEVGENTTFRLSLKTIAWVLGGLWILAGYAYFDLRNEIKEANTISIEEKEKFKEEFKEEIIEDMDDLVDITTDMRMQQVRIQGDIKLILDRQQRDNPIVANPNVDVQPILPPDEN